MGIEVTMMPVTGDCLRFVSQTSWDVSSMIALGTVFIPCFLTVVPMELLSGENYYLVYKCPRFGDT